MRTLGGGGGGGVYNRLTGFSDVQHVGLALLLPRFNGLDQFQTHFQCLSPHDQSGAVEKSFPIPRQSIYKYRGRGIFP